MRRQLSNSVEALPGRRVARIWREVLDLPREPAMDDDFLLLGGDSLALLKALNRVEEQFGVRPRLEDVFHLGTPARWAVHLGRLQAGGHALLDGEGMGDAEGREDAEDADDGPVPASAGQAGQWFLSLLYPEAPALYNRGVELVFQGLLDAAALARALAALARRHEALRSVLLWNARSKFLEQSVSPEPVMDFVALEAGPGELDALRRRCIDTPFQLGQPPLWRARLCSRGPRRHHLLVCLHHAISDGWSGPVFRRELAALYRQALDMDEAPLPPAARQTDFCRLEYAGLRGRAFVRARAYWRERLGDLPVGPAEVLDPDAGFAAGRCRVDVPAGLRDGLLALAGRQGLTLYLVLLGAFALLLVDMDGGTQTCIGTPVANRTRRRWENAIGYFANTVALRVDAMGSDLPHFLARLRDGVLADFAHADLPFQEVVRALERGPAEESPLFRYWFALHDTPAPPLDFGGPSVRLRRLHPGCCHYPLGLEVTPATQGLTAEFQYRRACFDRASVHRLGRRWLALLRGFADGGALPRRILQFGAQQPADAVDGGRRAE